MFLCEHKRPYLRFQIGSIPWPPLKSLGRIHGHLPKLMRPFGPIGIEAPRFRERAQPGINGACERWRRVLI